MRCNRFYLLYFFVTFLPAEKSYPAPQIKRTAAPKNVSMYPKICRLPTYILSREEEEEKHLKTHYSSTY